MDRAMFRVTFASTFVAVLATAAAFWAAYEAHKARVDDERPFIAVDTTPGQSPDSYYFETKIVAFGKSPARRVSITCDFVSDDESWNMTVPWKPTKSTPSAYYPYLLPGRSLTLDCGPLHSTRGEAMEDERVELGVVSYYDEKGNHYQTPFCVTLTPHKNQPIKVGPCFRSHDLPDLK
jgi:hypothetical protein